MYKKKAVRFLFLAKETISVTDIDIKEYEQLISLQIIAAYGYKKIHINHYMFCSFGDEHCKDTLKFRTGKCFWGLF